MGNSIPKVPKVKVTTLPHAQNTAQPIFPGGLSSNVLQIWGKTQCGHLVCVHINQLVSEASEHRSENTLHQECSWGRCVHSTRVTGGIICSVSVRHSVLQSAERRKTGLENLKDSRCFYHVISVWLWRLWGCGCLCHFRSWKNILEMLLWFQSWYFT